ncbi:MAG TPA: DUF2934 domain-containing protein [Paraburkholderia sp.]|jgi:hypothetical protein|nr:DUF2934 domain-containing protein [Paraburkholderia sp.]
MDQDLEARIRTRAYELWENDASPEGKADEYWEKALRQLEAEGAGRTAPPPAIEQSTKSRAAGSIPETPDDAG